MAEDRRKQAFEIGDRHREFAGVADADRLDLHQHLASRGPSRSTSMISTGFPAATLARVFIFLSQ